METKHTPGPWNYGVRKDGSIWLSLGASGVGPHYQGDLVATESDAKLIVAAPELLESLSNLVGLAKLGAARLDKYHAALADAEAVIAKATA
ncbi:hypothetical protein [Pseudomonas cyclaminis]|uniref:hypothetical protein n=1 Tax=Pseudomonas cyclaminis TaxID=2781239 RepID=UPI00381121B7